MTDSDPKKFCPSPSIASQMAKAQISREVDSLHGPHGLAEIIVSKMDTKEIPQTPEEIRLWIEKRKYPPKEWEEKKFTPPDASNPYQ